MIDHRVHAGRMFYERALVSRAWCRPIDVVWVGDDNGEVRSKCWDCLEMVRGWLDCRTGLIHGGMATWAGGFYYSFEFYA